MAQLEVQAGYVNESARKMVVVLLVPWDELQLGTAVAHCHTSSY